MKKKNIVNDIYTYLEKYPKVSDKDAKRLANMIAAVVTEKLQHYRKPSLSMSSIGKPARRLWMDIKYPHKPDGQARLKFLYGDIIEALIIWLLQQTGHKVTKTQAKVEVNGVPGSIDLLLDGELRDVKSCSSHSFKKFKEGTLPSNDPFGYCAQIAGYNNHFRSKHPGFIAVNKESGEICEYLPDPEWDLPNAKAVIDVAKKTMKGKDMPILPCDSPIPFGSSGNMSVPNCCKYCCHLKKCWPKARAFKYSTGTEYLTVVKKVPNVKEIKL